MTTDTDKTLDTSANAKTEKLTPLQEAAQTLLSRLGRRDVIDMLDVPTRIQVFDLADKLRAAVDVGSSLRVPESRLATGLEEIKRRAAGVIPSDSQDTAIPFDVESKENALRDIYRFADVALDDRICIKCKRGTAEVKSWTVGQVPVGQDLCGECARNV